MSFLALKRGEVYCSCFQTSRGFVFRVGAAFIGSVSVAGKASVGKASGDILVATKRHEKQMKNCFWNDSWTFQWQHFQGRHSVQDVMDEKSCLALVKPNGLMINIETLWLHLAIIWSVSGMSFPAVVEDFICWLWNSRTKPRTSRWRVFVDASFQTVLGHRWPDRAKKILKTHLEHDSRSRGSFSGQKKGNFRSKRFGVSGKVQGWF